MKWTLGAAMGLLLITGCSGQGQEASDPDNPFLQDQSTNGKADTAYLNPDGIEVEVDLEADVEGPAYSLRRGPAELGQFAMTYLRKRGEFYLESLAEDASSSARAEWLVDGVWLVGDQVAAVPAEKLRRFRLRGVNAVLLFAADTDAVEGKVFTAKVPLNPFTIMADQGKACADPDSHIGLDQSVYWYLWNPDRSGCAARVQEMQVTLSKKLAESKTVYPEWDRLVEDQKITVVILFGQIGDGEITESDPGMRAFQRMAGWLGQAQFAEVTPAPLGRRYTKTVGGVTLEFDLYSPHEFSGLGDYAHFANFQQALGEHEIVVYDGHSMLGASDFWSRPTYPDFYQIFLYGGCLGYEYYVQPILKGKQGWKNFDIVSSVVEVSADANRFAGPFLAKMLWAVDHGYRVSWRDMLVAIRKSVGDSTFGVSGVRENCYSPSGSLCSN